MPEKNSSIIPNTTQIPHIIIREWMPKLKDVELRVLLVVTDQTLGWVEDTETGRRKEKDWISRGQLMQKTGRSHTQVSEAVKVLVDVHRIIEAFDENGNLLDEPKKRLRLGKSGKIFYRLSLKHPPATLFDTRPKFGQQAKKGTNFYAVRIPASRKADTTKETRFTKVIAKASELDSNKNKNWGESVDKPGDPNRPKLPTNALMRSFNQYCKAIRKTKPIFVRFKDGNLIKHALKHMSEFQLEMLFIWFLQEKTKMQPMIGSALCKEVLADFIETSHKQYGFYGGLEQLARRYTPKPESEIKTEASSMIEALAKLKASFGMPFSHQERAAMAEETAITERTTT